MEWVTLRHASTGAEHRFPASALEGARARGWVEADAEAEEFGEQIGDSDAYLAVDDGYLKEE